MDKKSVIAADDAPPILGGGLSVKYSMAEYIFEHLQKVHHGQNKDKGWSAEYLYRAQFESQIRFLRDHGYIEFIEIKHLHDGKTNLVDTLVLTPVGRFLVPLRES